MDFQWHFAATRGHLRSPHQTEGSDGAMWSSGASFKKTFKDLMDIHGFMEYGYNTKIAMTNNITILR